MVLKLTLEDVHQMVEKAIEEKGADYVYPNWGPSCRYVDYAVTEDGRDCVRGCIVGHIFIDALGLDMLDLSHLMVNEENATQFLGFLARSGQMDVVEEDKGHVYNYLSALQQSQDNGKTWGEAHVMAKQGVTWNKFISDWEELV